MSPADQRPVRLLRVITRLNIGGPARQALLLTKRIAPRYQTRLIAGRPSEHEGELSEPGVRVEYSSLVRRPQPIDDVRALLSLRSIMQSFKPSIVHTHMAKAGTLARLAAFTVRRRPLLVHTFHGHVLEGYFSPGVTRTIIAAERALARRTDCLIAVSSEIRDQLLDLGIGEVEQYRVIPLGLELEAHRKVVRASGRLREQIGVGIEEPLVGIVGRVVPIKDHATALEAVARLDGVHLAVVGDGEEREPTRDLARQLGIADRVHFTGWWLDMPAVLSDLDVVLLTSRNEGTPVALIEAAACGRPAVATDVGGVRSVVTDNIHGFVVPPGDPEAVAAALARLLGSPGLRARMGQQARSDSVRFDAARLVADVTKIYEELLQSH